MKCFSHKGSLFWTAIKGLVIFLAKSVSVFIILPQSLIKFLPFSHERTHDLFDQ